MSKGKPRPADGSPVQIDLAGMARASERVLVANASPADDVENRLLDQGMRLAGGSTNQSEKTCSPRKRNHPNLFFPLRWK